MAPPERMSSGRTPSDSSKASSPSWTAGASAGTRPGGADDHSSISTSAPSGAASRSSASKAGTITAGSWSPTSRIETFASASTAITVFCRIGEPPWMPCTSTDGSAHVRM